MFKINGYIIDVAIEHSESYEANVSRFPREKGGSRTDNTDNLPGSLDITFKVSDTPIGEVAKARSANIIPSDEARGYLLALRDSREPFTIEIGSRIWEDYVFESLEFPVTAETGAALDGSATLVRIDFAEVTRTVVTDAPAKRRLGPKSGFVVTTPNVYYAGPGIPREDPHLGDEVYIQDGQWYFGDGDFPNKADQQLTPLQVQRLTESHTKTGVRQVPGTDTFVTTSTNSLPLAGGGDGVDVQGSYAPIRERVTSGPYRNGYLDLPMPAEDVPAPSSFPIAPPTGPIGN